MIATILDVSRKPHVAVTGKITKHCEQGIVIEDKRGVLYYAIHDRVINQPKAKPENLKINSLW